MKGKSNKNQICKSKNHIEMNKVGGINDGVRCYSWYTPIPFAYSVQNESSAVCKLLKQILRIHKLNIQSHQPIYCIVILSGYIQCTLKLCVSLTRCVFMCALCVSIDLLMYSTDERMYSVECKTIHFFDMFLSFESLNISDSLYETNKITWMVEYLCLYFEVCFILFTFEIINYLIFGLFFVNLLLNLLHKCI